MRVTATTELPVTTAADTLAVGVFADEGIAHDTADGALEALLDAGEARRAFKHVAVAHAAARRWLLVGLGERERFDAERARLAAAVAHARAREIGTRELCWEVPHHVGDDVAAALVEGTLLAAYRFDRYRRRDPDEPPSDVGALVLSAHHDLAEVAAGAAIVAEAQNAARDLQNAPANDCTPQALGERARALAEGLDGVTAEVHGPRFLLERGMGAFAAVTQGSEVEPALIVLRYEGRNAVGPLVGLVGKAVTHDTGGYSIKPAASMHEMKFDMSGGAAVLEAVGAVARLGLPVRLLGVVGATDNAISGRAVKPGDIVRAMTGTTIEVNNTDAEGRLVLCDCLAYAVELGAERIVDLATLTGGIVTALGSTYAGLFATDEDWAATVTAAAQASGELVWRMPLHPDYDEQIRGRYADLVNSEGRKAHPIQGASLLRRFVGDVPWAHLDIAGVAHDTGRAYAAKGGTGWGVRLLVGLARRVAAEPAGAR